MDAPYNVIYEENGERKRFRFCSRDTAVDHAVRKSGSLWYKDTLLADYSTPVALAAALRARSLYDEATAVFVDLADSDHPDNGYAVWYSDCDCAPPSGALIQDEPDYDRACEYGQALAVALGVPFSSFNAPY